MGGRLRRLPAAGRLGPGGHAVRQAPAGAEVLVVGAPADPAALGRALEAELARLGVPGPTVEVRLVDHLECQATGKVRRFLPLAAAEVSLPA